MLNLNKKLREQHISSSPNTSLSAVGDGMSANAGGFRKIGGRSSSSGGGGNLVFPVLSNNNSNPTPPVNEYTCRISIRDKLLFQGSLFCFLTNDDEGLAENQSSDAEIDFFVIFVYSREHSPGVPPQILKKRRGSFLVQ